MSTPLEQENTNQFNAEITYTNSSNYTIPVSYIKRVELMDAKPSTGNFAPNTASDYVVVTLYGIKGTNSNKSSLEHINNLLGATNITLVYYQYITPAKPQLYRIKIEIANMTFKYFKPSILDFENPGNTEYTLYFTYSSGAIIKNP